MIVHEKDITEGMRTHWAAASTLAALIPAERVYADRIAEKTAWPAAAIKVEEGDLTRCGSGKYLREFTVEVVAETIAANGDDDAIRAALSAAFGGDDTDPTAGLTLPGATVMHLIEERGGGVRPTPFRQNGSDFLRLTSRFVIMLHGEF